MTFAEGTRSIEGVNLTPTGHLHLAWSKGTEAETDLGDLARTPAFAALADPAIFRQVKVGEWGHSLAWPGEIEMGADSLWLETLSARGSDGAREFLEWRLRNALSLTRAADALGISRRAVAYYSNGERPVPRAIRLACRGWEITERQASGA